MTKKELNRKITELRNLCNQLKTATVLAGGYHVPQQVRENVCNAYGAVQEQLNNAISVYQASFIDGKKHTDSDIVPETLCAMLTV